MTDFEKLAKEVEDGILGKNLGIPMGFSRLNKFIGLRRANMYLVGGYTGSGKTSIVDDAFVLNPADWFIKNESTSPQKLKVIYWSMERKKSFKIAKWVGRKIFMDHGVIIDTPRMMGWVKQKMTTDEHDLFLVYEDYINRIQEVVEIMEMPRNPMGIKKFVDEYALKNGEVEQIDQYKRIYHPNNQNLITLIIYDHVGLLKGEERIKVQYRTKKAIIDLASEDARNFRDFYGFSPIMVSQFNRDISNPSRLKNGDVEPMLEDFKETGNTQEDADVVLSLFDPFRYKVKDPIGYDLDQLRGEDGRKMYRCLKLLKNTYGGDDIRVGLAFLPEIGLCKEMPKIPRGTGLSSDVYDSIRDNSFFLNERE